MKRIICMIMLITLVLALVPAFAEGAYTSGDFTYEIKGNGTAKITAYTGEHKDIILPVTIDGYTITAIGDSAFACEEKQANSITVSIPDSVTSIGEKAFWNRNVRLINLPDKTESIGYGAFIGCDNCKFRISANHPCFSVMDDALYDKARRELVWVPALNNGKSVVIPEGILSIGKYACYGLTIGDGLVLPSTLEKIAEDAFYGSSISKLTIPTSVTTIGENAFADVKPTAGKVEITISADNNLNRIDENAFNNKSIVINMPGENGFANLETLGEYAFCGVEFRGNVTIPESCRIIPEGAFCSAVGVNVSFEDGVEVIETDAFTGINLPEIYLPDTLSMISASAFDETVEFSVEKGSYAEQWAIQNARIYRIEGEEIDMRWLTGSNVPKSAYIGDLILAGDFEFSLDETNSGDTIRITSNIGSIDKEILQENSQFMYVTGNLKLLDKDIDVYNRIICEFVFDKRLTVPGYVLTEEEAFYEYGIDPGFKKNKKYWLYAEVHNDIISSYETCILKIGVKEEFTASDSLKYATFDNADVVYEIDLSPNAIVAPYEALQVGSKGDAVKDLQKKLIELGFLDGKADGIFGNGTANGVKRFQASEGLPQTGIADSSTQTVLFSK